MSVDQIAQQFVQHYYQTFSTNRQGLVSLYQQDSILTFEGEQHVGAQAIALKLQQLPFQTVQHTPMTMDVQPSINQSCILIFVNGTLKVDNEANQLKFSQVFQLVSSGGSNFYVKNDMFRINVG
jgi:hypothetical protein